MILYENTLSNFIDSANDKKVINYFTDEFTDHFSRKLDSETKTQWKYTIQIIKEVLKDAQLGGNVGIRIDYVITCNYRWFEIILAGRIGDENRIHIIEMLPFDSVIEKQTDEVYQFCVDDKKIEFVHPSLQSIGYKAYLRTNIDAVAGNTSIDVSSSVYLFECDDEDTLNELYSEKEFTNEVPIFAVGQEDKLISQLASFKNAHDGKEILMLLHSKDQLCSAGMESYIEGLFGNKKNKRLFAEQRYVASSVVSNVKSKNTGFFLLNGMAGTGKTTVAISIMKELKDAGYKVLYLNGTLATLQEMSNNIKRYSDESFDIKTIQRFVHEDAWDDYDAIILDEAQNTGYFFIHNYLKKTSKLPGTILFICSMIQCISERDHDFIDEIHSFSAENNINIKKFDLNANIRFSGQSSGINWLVHQLQIADTGNYEDWDVDTYKIEILDNPNDITKTIHQLHEDGELCRTIVRYDDIESISREYGEPCVAFEKYDFKMPVITATSQNSAKWYLDEDLYDYAVSVRLTQGTELDYACVIISDITIDKESGAIKLTDKQREIAMRRIMAKNSCDDLETEINNYVRIVLNGYYIALSRGKKGLFIYCADDDLREFLKDRLFYASRRYSWIKAFIQKYDFDSEAGIIRKEESNDIELRENDKYAYVTYIYRKFNNLLEGIKSQLKDVMDEESFKGICDQCSSLLLDLQKETIDDLSIVNTYTDSIVKHMGKAAWDKLSDLSKKCLISAEIVFHDLKDYNQLFDFSGVCVQVSKAVEYELANRYLTQYVDYLTRKYRSNLMDRIPKSLLNENGAIKTANIYTLGDVRFTVGMDSYGNIKNNYVYRQFSYYAKDKMIKDTQNIQPILSEHIQIIHKIKEDYRNKAAHKSSIDVVTAKECIDYVVETERKLGIMLDAYNY
ncbi:DUF2075 family protein [Lachnospiraceae bacterium A10]|nr:DUF2075 family protein [Lachnospiraceae bacterium A10]